MVHISLVTLQELMSLKSSQRAHLISHSICASHIASAFAEHEHLRILRVHCGPSTQKITGERHGLELQGHYNFSWVGLLLGGSRRYDLA